MDKLIELLNEYDDNNWEVTDYWALFNRMSDWITRTEDLQIISKSFWFIKWLVDNDKIDQFYYENSVRVKKYIDEYEEYDYVFPMDYEQLIMLLSIEDNPIEWLCKILK